jgi:hypothetical protein
LHELNNGPTAVAAAAVTVWVCLLAPGAADGCVRVWRAYLNHGLQRLATAWQAVPIRQPPALLRHGAAYALTEYPSLLYAAGGCHPDVLLVRL